MKLVDSITVLFFMFQSIAMANGPTVEGPRRGFHIEADLPPATSAGQIIDLSGKFCVWHLTGGVDKNPKCRKVKESQFETHAYFPDPFTEVSMTVDKLSGGREYGFQYQTPTISASDVNSFTLLIISAGKNHSNISYLLRFKSKLERRIGYFEQHIQKMIERGVHPDVISKFSNFITTLLTVRSKIQHALDARPEILARLELPLQVDNNIAGAMISTAIFDGFRIGLEARSGSLFEGDKSNITSSIHNLSFKDIKMPEFDEPDQEDDGGTIGDGKQYYFQTFFNDQLMFESAPENIAFDAVQIYSFRTPKLSNNHIPGITVKLIKYEIKDDGTIKKVQWGRLEHDIAVSADFVAPYWDGPVLPSNDVRYAQNFPLIKARVVDALGKIDAEDIRLSLRAELDSGPVNTQLLQNISMVTLDEGRSFEITGDINPLPEGDYELSYNVSDLAGNDAPEILRQIRIDRTFPQITLINPLPVLTNNPILDVVYNVSDRSPTQTSILHDQNLVFTSPLIFVSHEIILREGTNTITIQSTDSAGNVSIPITHTIILDTMAPALSNLTPANDTIINNLSFSVTGSSNEALLQVMVNGMLASLAADKKSFSATISAAIEGQFQYTIRALDLAGNESTNQRTVEVILRVLNRELISLEPAPNGGIDIIGAPGAARAGVTINAKVNTFNQQDESASTDGSFLFNFPLFSSITLTATENNRTDILTFNYNIDTTFSGKVSDHLGNPLPGVTVKIDSSGQTSITNASGMFAIANAATGDQIVTFDGTTIPLNVSGPNKKYYKTKIAVSIGVTQSNILDRAIFMTPLMFDGSETSIQNGSAATVTSAHAPGVVLDIPSGATIFPDGTNTGIINIMEISGEATSIPTPDFATPQTVISLEPSGLKFSTPIQLTLPNVNEIPAGVQVVILSRNSLKGIWEIDGIARVSENGSEIVTVPGMGITHFSDVYAVPLGPTVKQIGAQDIPGSSMFDGSLSTAITLPSYRVLGQDIAPSLSYNSAWAHPTLLVSNLFDVPRNEFSFTPFSAGQRSLFGRAEVSVTGTAWIEPDFVTARFTSGNLDSGPMTFTGIPQKSVVSYAMDFSSQSSGIQPYLSHYDIHLKQMVFGTRTIATKKLFGKTKITQEHFQETRALEQVFPQDISGPVYVQNKKSSEVGVGWKINSGQRILNPSNTRVLIEEATGAISSYSVNDKIESLYNSNNITYASLLKWPMADVLHSNNTTHLIDLSSGATSITRNAVGDTSGYSDLLTISFNLDSGFNFYTDICSRIRFSKTKVNIYNNIVSGTDAPFLLEKDGVVYKIDNQLQKIAGLTRPLNQFSNSLSWSDPQNTVWTPSIAFYVNNSTQSDVMINSSDCNILINEFGMSPRHNTNGICEFIQVFNHVNTSSIGSHYITNFNSMGEAFLRNLYDNNAKTQCGTPQYDPLEIAVAGFSDSLSGQFNDPRDGLLTLDGNYLLIADSGNNRVRKFNLSNNTVTTIAGNGQTFDNGDGNLATNASLFHPKALALDNIGNLYIATERGFIRKLDTVGRISTFAGNLNGLLVDKTIASNLRLNNPSGLVVDNDNGFLYVADTGHHRVVKIDFTTLQAEVVAGNGSCIQGSIGDEGPALAASLCSPHSLGLDGSNNLLIFDKGHNRIRRVIFENAQNSRLSFASTMLDNTKLFKNADGTWEREYRNGTKVFFNQDGNQIRQIDRAGRELTFTFDSQKRLVRQRDPLGGEIVYNYSGDLLDNIVDTVGRTTTFFYSGNTLSEVVFPDGTSRSFAYDSKGLLTQETNQRQFSSNYRYNIYNRLLEVERPDGSKIQVNDAISGTAGNNFIGGNQGTFKKFGSGESDLKNIVADAKNIKTEFIPDTNGFIQEIIDGEGKTTKIERNIHGDPTKIIRPDLSEVTFTYNTANRDLISRFDSSTGAQVTFTYNSFGQLLSQTSPSGLISSNIYDNGTGLLTSASNSAGQATSYTYFPLGLIKEVTNSLGHKVAYEYFPDGNLSDYIAPDLTRTEFGRDDVGNIIATTNAKGQTVQREFDEWNRLKAVISAKAERTEYFYLATGELSKIRDPLGKEVNFVYNNMGQLDKKIDQLGHETVLVHDPNGNVTSERDPNGNLKLYEYDELDRLIKKTLPDDLFELSYDGRGNLATIKNNTSELDFEYEQTERGDQVRLAQTRGLGVKSSYPVYELEFDFDESGNRISMTTAVGTFNYEHDVLGRLTGLINHKNENFSFAFDSINRLTQITRPGGKTIHTFDSTNFLSNMSHFKGSSLVKEIIYGRDSIGNRTSMTVSSGSYLWDYDSNNQLISASNPEVAGDFSSEAFSYDQIGNRTQDQLGDFFFDSTHQRLTEDYRYLYVHDNNGNLISKQGKGALTGLVVNYIYNSQNQMVGFRQYQGLALLKSADYFFNAIGQRMEKIVTDHFDVSKSFTRRYVYHDNEILHEMDESNTILATYTHSGLRTDDTLAVDITASGVTENLAIASGSYFFLKDGLGSITEITNSSGDIIQRQAYSAFGKLLSVRDGAGADITTAPTLTPYFSYTNRELDAESGCYFYRARMYCPNIGRFLQQDPHPGRLASPVLVNNKYSYAVNNPTNLTDPEGRIPPLLVAIAIGAIIGGISAHIQGESILAGAFAGAVYGGVIFGGIALGGAVALGAGAGAISTIFIKILFAGFITGMFNVQTGEGTFEDGFVMGATAAAISEAIELIFSSGPIGEGSDSVPTENPNTPPLNKMPNYNPASNLKPAVQTPNQPALKQAPKPFRLELY